MTAEKLHDAISLLPVDLIDAADEKRQQKPRSRPARRQLAAIAACFGLVLACGLFLRAFFLTGGSKSSTMTMAEPAAVEQEFALYAPTQAADEALITDEAAEEAPAEAAPESAAAGATSSMCIDHAHNPIDSPETGEDTVGGYCGNTMAVLSVGDEAYTLYGSDAIALTDILINLDYSPETVCRCTAEYTADTETKTGFEISLTAYFVRCEDGQAALTEEQAEVIRDIIDRLGM